MRQVSQERDGKTVDGKCHSLTASHIRLRHKADPSIPICGFYEVNISDYCNIDVFRVPTPPGKFRKVLEFLSENFLDQESF